MSQNKEHVCEVSELAHRLVNLDGEQEHGVVLQAFISAYVAVAINHPCCARNSSGLLHVANLIEIRTAAAPAGTAHIH